MSQCNKYLAQYAALTLEMHEKHMYAFTWIVHYCRLILTKIRMQKHTSVELPNIKFHKIHLTVHNYRQVWWR
jgi:hypothetical protein